MPTLATDRRWTFGSVVLGFAASLGLCACAAPAQPREAPGARAPAPLASPKIAEPALASGPRTPGQWQALPSTDPRTQKLPATPREFRGVWVATVDNIDWPSSKNLTSEAQQAEMVKILDAAQALNFNAIILQVRPTCDAIYPSAIEPWSEFLTGRSGRPPSTLYDPLKMWIDGAHARGLQLHAWINPFRARHEKTQFPDAAWHVSKTNPAMVKKYGEYLWMDPGESWVQDRTISVVRDILTRYDVDGIHIDDYFYPYPQKKIEFDDRGSYARYQSTGGRLARDDWRRENVDRFVERLYHEVKSIKREALLGISPFGIWRPGNPAGIQSMDPYLLLHADSKKWLNNGWLDYMAPQLYWPVDSKGQPFEPLLKWWVSQNTRRRHVWPGIYTSRVGTKEGKPWPAMEIARQIDTVRRTAGAGGVLQFSAVALIEKRPGLMEVLQRAYSTPAIVPASPWLDASAPGAPGVTAIMTPDGSALKIALSSSAQKPFRYVIGAEYAGNSWRCQVLAGDATSMSLRAAGDRGAALKRVVVSSVDRLGNESARVVLVP